MKNKHPRVSFWLTNDISMKKVNKEVFDKKTTTDVISIPLSGNDSEPNHYLGEIVVDQEEVARNAKKFKVSYDEELARVVAHGVLHLLGHEDKSTKGKAAMRAIESAIVEEFSQDPSEGIE